MLAFFKGLYKIFRCIREFFVSLFFIIFVLIIFSLTSLFNSSSNEKNTPTQQGALSLNLDGYLADNREKYNDLYRLLQSELSDVESVKISTFDVVRVIRKAAYDDNITGLVLDLNRFQGGDFASLSYIGSIIEKFKESNKPVIAIGDSFTQAQYYLASFADEIYLNKAGFVDIHGLNYSNLYFKSMLDKIEAQPHIFRVGTYKSAVEPFIRDDMSPEARQNAQLWINSLWQQYQQRIATNRKIDKTDVLPEFQHYLTRYKAAKGDSAVYALNQKLVTHIASNSEIEDQLIKRFGKDLDGNYKRIDFFDYVDTLTDRFNLHAQNKIAVINVEGEIFFGPSDNDKAGSDTIVQSLQRARLDDNVKGVILRINSPGGSAMASELIRQEVSAIQAAGKPVVASMGGMAASGGYWIAATADKIIASPDTITGSIGIFGLAVTFEKTAKRFGFTEDGIATSPLAKSSALSDLPKEQGEIIQVSIENGYDRFIELVSKGRKMSKDAVDKVAQGQVWIGEAALDKGLVDKLGDFDTAFSELKTLINEKQKAENQPQIEKFKAQWFVNEKQGLLGALFSNINSKIKLEVANTLGLPLALTKKAQAPLDSLSQFNDPKGQYLYCLNCGVIK